MFDIISSLKTNCNPITLEKTLHLAIEIAREGREGKRIGTFFVVGDEENVLNMSRNMILDPLLGHPDDAKRIIEKSSVDIVYIENDMVRRYVIKELGLKVPQYLPEEHRLVFDVSHELIWLALSFSYHTIFDATNLNEKYRKAIYKVADSIGAEVLIIKTVVDYETAKRRSRKKFESGEVEGYSTADISIYELLSAQDEDMEMCSRPYLLLDTAKKSAGWYIDKHKLALKE